MKTLVTSAILTVLGLTTTPALGQLPTDTVPQAIPISGAPPIVSLGSVEARPTNDIVSMAISPDGRELVFAAEFRGRNALWLQNLDTSEAFALPGTEEGFDPFWSPDGRRIGFFGNDQLKRLDLDTGLVDVLVPVATWGAGGSWGPNGTILYATHGGIVIKQVSTEGGVPRQALPVFAGSPNYSAVRPQFLPDGRSYLYYVQGPPEERGIYVAELGGRSTQKLVDSNAAGVYALGRLFYLDEETLVARAFDTATLSLTGPPEPIAVAVPIGRRSSAALASSANHVVYRTGAAGSVRQLTWYNRDGTRIRTIGDSFPTGAGAPSLSPDGTRAVVNVLVDGLGDIWTVDLASGESMVIEGSPGNDSYPIWSFDGSAVLFSSTQTAFYPMYRKAADASGVAELAFPDPTLRHPMDWSPDGRYLVYRRNTPDLWVADMLAGAEYQVASSTPPVRWPQISPDGRWIAFQSEASGQSEIHLHGPLDASGSGPMSSPVSVGGGAWVRWRGDGRELFYAAPDGMLMAVNLALDADGQGVTASSPIELFRAPMAGGPLSRSYAQQYMVSDDGQRFLVLEAPLASSPVHVIGSGGR